MHKALEVAGDTNYLRPLSHELSNQVCLSICQADLIGSSMRVYWLADVNGLVAPSPPRFKKKKKKKRTVSFSIFLDLNVMDCR